MRVVTLFVLFLFICIKYSYYSLTFSLFISYTIIIQCKQIIVFISLAFIHSCSIDRVYRDQNKSVISPCLDYQRKLNYIVTTIIDTKNDSYLKQKFATVEHRGAHNRGRHLSAFDLKRFFARLIVREISHAPFVVSRARTIYYYILARARV